MIAKGYESSRAEASISEEPGAVIPHAGICAGGGRVTALSTATAVKFYEYKVNKVSKLNYSSTQILIDIEESMELARLYLISLEEFISGLSQKYEQILDNNSGWAEKNIIEADPPDEAIKAFRKLEFIEQFPDILRGSLFVALYGFIESQLDQECKAQRDARNDIVLSPSDISGRTIDRSKTYLSKVLKINFRFDTVEWQRIKKYKKLRNCLVHNNGNLNGLGDSDEKDIKNFISNNQSLSLYGYRVVIQNGFVEEVITTIEKFFSDLLSSDYSILPK